MRRVENFPNIGFEHLGPYVDAATAELRAVQLTTFMNREVHVPVYEETLGLPYVSDDPRSGTPQDMPWRVEKMPTYNTMHPDRTYVEYILALDLDEQGRPSTSAFAVAGLVVASKPRRCGKTHVRTTIEEIDVAQRMYGTGLAAQLLDTLQVSHPEDPRIDLLVCERNQRARNFYGKLGFALDEAVPPVQGDVYGGQWVTLATDGATFYRNLATLVR